ncbi:MAG: polysaccharide deacetylase family protein [Caldilineaceae bacterium]
MPQTVPGPAQETEPGGKVLYLTFDDGPSGYTQPILDVLARHGAQATFFMLGRQANGKQELQRAMYDAGHGIANHTYNHPYLTALSKARFRDEVIATSAAIGGLDHGCLRPPYGASNKTVRAEAGELGYTLVTWTIDPRDWSRPGAAAIAQRVISRASPGGVVVMHDGGGDRTQTVAALETILTELGAQGYQFRALCRDGALPPPTSQQQVQPRMGPDSLPQPEPAATVPAGPSGAITQPTGDTTLHGAVSVKGFARHNTFHKWQLDLLIDGAGETFLAFGESPVVDPAELYTWDTTRYPNGEHVLRLRVVYEGMNYDEYAVPVTIAN